MEAIRFDEGHWPILVVHFQAQPTDDDFRAYLDRYLTYVDRRTRYAIVMAAVANLPMTRPRHAKMQADWIHQHRAELAKQCAGIAFVLPSPITRGVLRAILRMQGLPMQHSVFRDMEPALAWATQTMETEAVHSPRHAVH